MKQFRVAVIGLNHYHVTGWVDSLGALGDRVEIVARYDPDAARSDGRPPDYIDPSLRQDFPHSLDTVPFFSDLDALLADQHPDVALVTLPNDRAPDAISGLSEAGVHLLVDKPGARNAREAEVAFGKARSAGVKAAVGLTRRYGRGWQDVRSLIAAGELGELITTESIFATSSVLVRDPANPIFKKEVMGGGVLHWLGVHDLDALLWLTGERIVEVQATMATVEDLPIDVENVCSASIRYASGALGTVHMAYALPRPGGEGHIAIRGTRASVRILADGSWVLTGPGTATDPETSRSGTYTSGPSTGYGSGGAVIIDDLLDAVEEDREPRATGEDVTEVLRVIDAMYESANSGTRVNVGIGNTRTGGILT